MCFSSLSVDHGSGQDIFMRSIPLGVLSGILFSVDASPGLTGFRADRTVANVGYTLLPSNLVNCSLAHTADDG